MSKAEDRFLGFNPIQWILLLAIFISTIAGATYYSASKTRSNEISGAYNACYKNTPSNVICKCFSENVPNQLSTWDYFPVIRNYREPVASIATRVLNYCINLP